MNKIITAIYDGRTLCPDTPLDLRPNERYIIIIQGEAQPAKRSDAWVTLADLAGSVDAPEDWAIEHDRYLYGTSTRGKETKGE